MNGKEKYLIDTVILIDHLNGVKKATNWLARNGKKNSVISVITRAEILVGVQPEERFVINELLNSFTTLTIDLKTADIAAEMRKKYKLKLPDAFQAALANMNNLLLVTRNTKDFKKEMNFVKIPYAL